MTEPTLESRFLHFRSTGDVQELATVFDLVAPDLLALAGHLSRDAALAEDLVQQTFLVAIEKRGGFDSERSLLPWMLGILVNEARSARRAQGRRIDPARLAQPDILDPRGPVLESELASSVEHAVAQLPEKYGRVLALHLLQGVEPREIAERLGLEPATARVHIHRGLALLRKALPASFALGAAAVVETRGLAAVREVVLARGATAKAVATTSLGAGVVWLCGAIVAGGVALATWILVHDEGGARELVAQAPLSHDAPASVSRSTIAQPSAHASEVAPPLELARSAERAPVASMSSGATFVGSLRLESGEPAAGASVTVASWSYLRDDPSRAPTTDWTTPAPVAADVDGRFALHTALVEGARFFLRAQHPGCAAIDWAWPAFDDDSAAGVRDGETIDLGEARFAPGGSVSVRIVDDRGEPVADARWHARLKPLASVQGIARFVTSREVQVDPVEHLARERDVAAGWYELEALHPVAGRAGKQRIEVRAGEETSALIHPALDGTTSVRLDVRVERFLGLVPRLEHVQLTSPGADPRGPRVSKEMPNELVWDGLDAREYTLAIDDPRFERWTKSGVAPGTRVRADLRGSAALKLDVREAGAARAPEALTVHAVYRGAGLPRSSMKLGQDEFVLHDEHAPWHAGDVTSGLLPGPLELHVTAPGHAKQVFQVAELRAHEMRALQLELSEEHAFAGVTRASDGTTPVADVVVQATRGPIAGRTPNGRGARFVPTPGRGAVSPPDIDRETRSDARGAFRFEALTPGVWTFSVVWSPWLVSEHTLDVGSKASEPIELVRPPSGFLVGTLLPPNGTAAADMPLTLTPRVTTQRPDVPGLFQRVPDGSIGADGAFRFGPLPAGEVRIELTDVSSADDAREKVRFTSLRPITSAKIDAGRETRVDLDLRGAIGGRVELHVTVGGAPTQECQAFLVPAPSSAVRPATSCMLSQSGRASFRAPGGAGPFTLAVQDLEHGWVWTALEPLALSPDETRALEFDVPLHTARVLCVDAASGAPLAGVRVAWTVGEGELRTAGSASCDEHGELELSLPAATMRFLRSMREPEHARELRWPPAPGTRLALAAPAAR